MQHQHVSRVYFDNGNFLQAPTDQWIALIFSVLHPTQQEAIQAKIQEMQDAHTSKPLVEIPGFAPPTGVLEKL